MDWTFWDSCQCSFSLVDAIAQYLEEHGIDSKVDCYFDHPDPDAYRVVDLTVSWREDGERQWFTVRNAQRYDHETLFTMWVAERESLLATC